MIHFWPNLKDLASIQWIILIHLNLAAVLLALRAPVRIPRIRPMPPIHNRRSALPARLARAMELVVGDALRIVPQRLHLLIVHRLGARGREGGEEQRSDF